MGVVCGGVVGRPSIAMNFFILCLALILIPFCLKFNFFPVSPNEIVDYRSTKDFLGTLFCLAIFLTTSQIKIDNKKNLWLKILIAYLLIHHWLVAKFEFDVPTDQMISNLWQYKPLAYVFIYVLLFWSVQAMTLCQSRLRIILQVMAWMGFLSAVYLIIQYFGFDPWQVQSNTHVATQTRGARMSSFYSHPNYAGSFIGWCIIPTLYLRKFLPALLMLVAVVLSKSVFALGATIFGLAIYLGLINSHRFRIWFWALCGYAVYVTTLILILDHNFPEDSGRFNTWVTMIKDTAPQLIYGFGLGSFAILFQSVHGGVWREAHNEILQFFFYETGLVGLLIFGKCVVEFFKQAVDKLRQNQENVAFFSIFCMMAFGSMGLFLLQIDPHRFYIVMTLAILTNQSEGVR